jgi:hypothetical protein
MTDAAFATQILVDGYSRGTSLAHFNNSPIACVFFSDILEPEISST